MLDKILIVVMLSVSVHSGAISVVSGGLGLGDDHGVGYGGVDGGLLGGGLLGGGLYGGHGISIAQPIASHVAIASPYTIAKPLIIPRPIAIAKPVAVAKEVVDYNAPAHYEFKYGVQDPHTGDSKQQSEVRVGDSVKGEYSVAEPDGTIRVVKYTADDHNGFNAVVTRIGKAQHPDVVVKKAIVAPVLTKTLVSSHGLGLDLGGHY